MIELSWKLFVLSLAVINPTLPAFHFTYIVVHYILSCYRGNAVTKGTCRMKLHRELTFFNNSIIYKNVELKFSMDTYSGPLISESNINPIPLGIFCITHTHWGGGGRFLPSPID